MIREFRLMIRRLGQAPLFVAFAVATIALAIGLTTTVYTVIRAGLEQNLGLSDPDRVAAVASQTASGKALTRVSWSDYRQIQDRTPTLESLAAWVPFTNALVARGKPAFVQAEAVNGSYFAVVGLRAARGRLLDASDDEPGAAPVVVLSEAAWRTRFGRDPRLIGEVVKLAGSPFQVVGVVPSPFRGVAPPRGFVSAEVWVPFATAGPALDRRMSDTSREDVRPLQVIGRLRAGTSMAKAAADLDRLGQSLDAAAPLPERAYPGGVLVKQPRRWTAFNPAERLQQPESNGVLRAILMLPVLVLLVACTNLANFALSRGVARQQEFAVCRALGATRWRVMRGQLLEHAVIAGLGALGAVAIAHGLLGLFDSAVRNLFGDLPEYRFDTTMNARVFAAAGLAAILSFLVAGLIPAFRLTGRGAKDAIATDQGAGALPRWRGRSNLIALQVAVSVALLLVSALCVRQLPKFRQPTVSAMSLDRVALVSVPFARQSMDEQRARRVLDVVLQDVRGLPGVSAASISSESGAVALARDDNVPDTRDQSTTAARVDSVSPEYFATTGLPLKAGRPFDGRDDAAGAKAMILSASLATRIFGRTDPVGQTVSAADVGNAKTIERYMIVGIAADPGTARGRPLDRVFVPFAQRFDYLVPVDVQARGSGDRDPAALAWLMRERLRRVDPDVAVAFVGTADAAERGSRTMLGYIVTTLVALAGLALVFTMSGLYGVLTHLVARRTRELGVRAALGAEPRQLIVMVMKDGVRPVVEGLIIGLAAAVGARLGMQSWFVEPVTAVDPVALVMAFVPLLAAAGVAAYLPGRRAARVDPNVALRHL